LFSIAASEQGSRCSYMQSDIALEFDRSDQKRSRRDQDSAATIMIAGVNRGLKRLRIERNAIALRSITADIVDTRTHIVDRGALCRSFARCALTEEPRSE